jgi:hypothetical protein
MSIAAPWRDLLAEPIRGDHLVQVYEDDEAVVDAISLYAEAALGRREGVLLVVTPEHREAIEARLEADGIDVATVLEWGQLVFHDAQQTLDRFMIDGAPDRALFRLVVGDALDGVRATSRSRTVRVYGEMVNLLWTHNQPAAERLEEHWNELIEEQRISLFCAYAVAGRALPSTLRDKHTHCIPL